MADVRKPTTVAWNRVEKVGYPAAALRVCSDVVNTPPRTFLVTNDSQIECAYAFDGGFETSDSFQGEVTGWAVIEGF